MSNVSLVKITMGVAFAAVATFIAHANEIAPTVTEVQEPATIEAPSVLPTLDSTQPLPEVDADKNGSLSETELSESGNEALKSSFKDSEINEDISTDESETHKGVSLD